MLQESCLKRRFYSIEALNLTNQNAGKRAPNVRMKVDISSSEGEVDVVLGRAGHLQHLVPHDHVLLDSPESRPLILPDVNITQHVTILLAHFVSRGRSPLAPVRFGHLAQRIKY